MKEMPYICSLIQDQWRPDFFEVTCLDPETDNRDQADATVQFLDPISGAITQWDFGVRFQPRTTLNGCNEALAELALKTQLIQTIGQHCAHGQDISFDRWIQLVARLSEKHNLVAHSRINRCLFFHNDLIGGFGQDQVAEDGTVAVLRVGQTGQWLQLCDHTANAHGLVSYHNHTYGLKVSNVHDVINWPLVKDQIRDVIETQMAWSTAQFTIDWLSQS